MDTFVTDPVVAGTDAGTGADRAWLARIPLAIGLAATLAIAIRPANDPDLWWHLATGRYIVGTGAIPREDVFSFTAAGHRWVTHEWLSDLMLYGGFRWLGLNGLALVFAAIITGSVALVYLRCRARPVIAAGSLLLGAAATGMTWGVRPQVFTIMFVALFLHILEGGQGPKGRKLWVLPPLALVWGNLHSGFVAGLAIMAVVTLGELLKWWRNWRPGLPLVSPGVPCVGGLRGVLAGDAQWHRGGALSLRYLEQPDDPVPYPGVAVAQLSRALHLAVVALLAGLAGGCHGVATADRSHTAPAAAGIDRSDVLLGAPCGLSGAGGGAGPGGAG